MNEELPYPTGRSAGPVVRLLVCLLVALACTMNTALAAQSTDENCRLTGLKVSAIPKEKIMFEGGEDLHKLRPVDDREHAVTDVPIFAAA